MSSTAVSLQQGKRIPDWVVKDQDGQSHTLSDYRQKSHLVLLVDPQRSGETEKCWLAAIEADRKQWEWLNVKVLVVDKAPKDLAPGVYAIDRYGLLLNHYSAKGWNFSDLERDFLYYEAAHC